MDFRLDDRSAEILAEARGFLDEQMTEELDEQVYRTGVSHDEGFAAALRERGWYAAGWPEEWGGAGLAPLELLALRAELLRYDAPTYAIGTTMMGAKAVQLYGSEDLRAEIVPRALRGEILIVLGFSEPEAGSDVANAKTRAVRDGDEWVVSGSKMFTTNAHLADYAFLLTRTNPEVPKHKGLTTFLVPLDHPGVEVQAVYTLSGERTNITYYDDVRIDDRWRIGDVDGGWRVMTGTLQDEHSAGFAPRLESLLTDAEAWARDEAGADGRPRIDDADTRARLARAATETEVAHLLNRRVAWMHATGAVPEAEGPMNKLFSSESMERCAQDLCELVGPDALRSRFEPTAPRGGRIEHALRFSVGTTIYAGSSEIQRNIIAQRGLGLPR